MLPKSESPRALPAPGAFLFPPLDVAKEKNLHKFSKDALKVLQMFVTHKSVRVAYYAAIGAAYLYALAKIIQAIRWW